MQALSTLGWYALAAVLEIAGCFAFWLHFKLGRPVWWLAVGAILLLGFAWALTRIPAGFAGRAFAAYGGVYIGASLLWLWVVERQAPDGYDLAGGLGCLLGAALILLPARGL